MTEAEPDNWSMPSPGRKSQAQNMIGCNQMSKPSRHQGWSIPRLVPLPAGTFVLISTLLAAVVSQWWLIFTGFIGANLLLYGTVGWCPSTLLLRRLGVPDGSTSRATPRT